MLKRAKSILFFSILTSSFAILFVAILAGCPSGQTPARKAFVSVGGATIVVNGVNDAYKLGGLSKAQLTALLPYLDAVHVAQDDLDRAILAGNVDTSSYAQALTDAVSSLLTAEAKIKAVPTTNP